MPSPETIFRFRRPPSPLRGCVQVKFIRRVDGSSSTTYVPDHPTEFMPCLFTQRGPLCQIEGFAIHSHS